jgi:hypothetical protein
MPHIVVFLENNETDPDEWAVGPFDTPEEAGEYLDGWLDENFADPDEKEDAKEDGTIRIMRLEQPPKLTVGDIVRSMELLSEADREVVRKAISEMPKSEGK